MIEISSTNPDFSFIIQKNPNTQRESKNAFERSMRLGTIYGWFFDDQKFRMMFVDSPTQSSFCRQGDFEYLDRTRYSSSYLPIAAINELLATAMKKQNPKDVDGYVNTFTTLIELSNFGLAQRMLRNMPEVTLVPITFNGKQCRDLFRFNVVTSKSIHHMLSLVQVFCILQAIQDWNIYVPMDAASAKKYVRSLNVIDAPYYLRYTFQAFGVQSPEVFEQIKAELTGELHAMNYGKTDQHRLNGILPQLPGGECVWDIGCGEMRYSKRLSRVYSNVIACDASDEIQEKNSFRLKWDELKNIELRGKITPESFADFKPGSDILMTEVLEHMPKEDAMALLTTIAKLPYRNLVMSVPNREFNQFYGIGDGFRHVDHHYEPTVEEFRSMLIEAGFDNLSEFNCSDSVRHGDVWISASIGMKNTKNIIAAAVQ